MTNFRSDNESPAAPEIIDALIEANSDSAHAYGADKFTVALDNQFSELFETECRVFPLATGTAANSLGLAQVTPPHGSVLCHAQAHIHVDECGAPEFFSSGAKLIPIDGDHGRIDLSALEQTLAMYGFKGDHEPKISTLSITQATECGSVYHLAQLQQLCGLARQRGMVVHMDGARLANAVASLNCSPADMTWRAGVDVLSFGATKNGTIGAEALIFFDPAMAEGFGKRRMKGGHLLSKMRYCSAQLAAIIKDDLWLNLARSANAGASRIAEALAAHPAASVVHPVDINEVFAVMDQALADKLLTAGFEFHRWPFENDMYRFVVPWNIEDQALRKFEAAVTG